MIRDFPSRHARRDEADNSHAHSIHIANHIRRNVRHASRVDLLQIRRQPRKMRFALRLPHRIEAEIEFVIADGHRIVVHCIERGDRRVRLRRVLLREIVDERRPLRRISAIEQQRMRRLRALLLHERRHFCQSVRHRFIGVIIPGSEMAMRIRCAQQRDCHRRRPRVRWLSPLRRPRRRRNNALLRIHSWP